MKPQAHLEIEMVPVDELCEYEGNAKLHPTSHVEQIAASIEEFSFADPIGAWHDEDGNAVIVEGHGRLLAARKLGIEKLPVIFLDYMSDEQRRSYTLVHNQLSMVTGFDAETLKDELDSITDIDMSQFSFDVEGQIGDFDSDVSEEPERGSLSDRFIVPPFSVLNTRSGDWQERKRMWLEKTGNLSETRNDEYGSTFGEFSDEMGGDINQRTSNFDPVLAETMLLWFCPSGGKVLDPFGGEQTKGIVAGECGYRYVGMEIRKEQVELNSDATSNYQSVRYVCGDSNDIEKTVDEHDFDMCFTSPPYYDLEVYSANDMSALGTYEEFMRQYDNIFAQCYRMLKENSFLVIKVGEIRDKKTGEYRNFVSDTISSMLKAGFKYYNEIILVNSVGTAAMRANGNMKYRKVCKVHQNVLVFYKGDFKSIRDRLGDIEFEEKELNGEVI